MIYSLEISLWQKCGQSIMAECDWGFWALLDIQRKETAEVLFQGSRSSYINKWVGSNAVYKEYSVILGEQFNIGEQGTGPAVSSN